MTRDEYYLQKLEELFDGIDDGDFSKPDSIPDKYHFDSMEALFYNASKIDGGDNLYRQLFRMVNRKGWNAVRDRLTNGNQIKVTFLAISAAEWPTGELYNMLKRDERFDVSVTVAPLMDRNIDDRRRTYIQTRDFMFDNKYNVIDTYDVENDHVSSWEELDSVPDMVIHVTYWADSLPVCFHIRNFPLKTVNLYVPYGFSTCNSTNGNFIYAVETNKEIFNIFNCAYVNSELDRERFYKYQLLMGENIEYSGYSKMDFFYNKKEYSEDELRKIWKIPEGKSPHEMKKVIIAPHHSFLGYAGIMFSTFAKNAHFLLYLAEKYSDEICFMLKPHPNLRLRAVEAKVFNNSDEYDNYIEKWNKLPNANVVVEGDYLNAFATSDAIIMDSISFIAEYMYVKKPVLYLRREEQAFSPLGEACLNVFSQADGTAYYQIDQFLENTVVNGNDLFEEERDKVFEKYLDYYGDNGCLASEYIYNDICMKIEG